MQIKNLLFTTFSIMLFLLLVLALYKEVNPEWPERSVDWRDYQKEYYKKLSEKLGDKKITKTSLEVKQIWNSTLNRADRCTTCHLGIDKSIFANEVQPFKSHPKLDGYMSKHKFEKFGCTICHEGDGQTIKYGGTHKQVHHIDRQPLSGVFLQSSCTKCHLEFFSEELDFPDVPVLMEGKKLAAQLGCGSCHTIKQFGTTGTQAPDISTFGSRTELSFYLVHDSSYVNLEGEHSMINWEWEHFKNPIKIMPGNPDQNLLPTIMPNFGLDDKEATALTVLMMSLKDPKSENIPTSYIPKLEANHKEFMQFR